MKCWKEMTMLPRCASNLKMGPPELGSTLSSASKRWQLQGNRGICWDLILSFATALGPLRDTSLRSQLSLDYEMKFPLCHFILMCPHMCNLLNCSLRHRRQLNILDDFSNKFNNVDGYILWIDKPSKPTQEDKKQLINLQGHVNNLGLPMKVG